MAINDSASLRPPLILTLQIEKETAEFFNLLRKKHFPPSRNFIDAHITLFHALPHETEIVDAVENICNNQKPFEIIVKDVVSIGKGVAFKVESAELMQLHKSLQNKWKSFLSPQDNQKLWPHITVQNKVALEEAQQLLHQLKTSFKPFSTSAIGLQLFEYLNGPWKSLIFCSILKAFLQNK